MKKWKAYIQINGDCQSIYETVTFDISAELYDEIQTAIANGVPLYKCPFYGELCDKAENAFDLAEYLELSDDEPDRYDYDDEEEYQEAMEEYNDAIENVWDEYCLVSLDIDDPGDEVRFIANFVGKVYPNYAGVDEESFEFEKNDETCAKYSMNVHFDENGKITAITGIGAIGLEAEWVNGSSYSDAYPDYDFMQECLEEALAMKTLTHMNGLKNIM